MKLRIALIVCTLTVLFAAVPAFADDASANAKKEQEIQKLLVDKLGKDAEAIRVTIVGDKIDAHRPGDQPRHAGAGGRGPHVRRRE